MPPLFVKCELVSAAHALAVRLSQEYPGCEHYRYHKLSEILAVGPMGVIVVGPSMEWVGGVAKAISPRLANGLEPDDVHLASVNETCRAGVAPSAGAE